MSNEEVLLNEGGVVVTGSELQVPGRTIKLKGLISIQVVRFRPGLLEPAESPKKPSYCILVVEGGVQTPVYATQDEGFVARFHAALDRAVKENPGSERVM